MKVWLVTVGEPLPIDRGNPRLFRTGLLAKYLTETGHDVVWFSSTFDHAIKKERFSEQTRIAISDSYEIIALHGRSYRKNLSVSRILNHRDIAKEFKLLAPSLDKPDIVVSSFPTIELCYEVTEYCHKWNIPCVTDVRDLWPDIFVDAVPVWLKPLASIAISGMKKQTREIFQKTTQVAGITDSYLQWGITKAGREKTPNDHVYHLTNASKEYEPEVLQEAKDFLISKGLDTDKTIVVFVGIMSLRKFCLDTVIKSIDHLDTDSLQFVFAGDGDDLDQLKKMSPTSIFTGWVDEPKLQVLLTHTSVAIAPYRSSKEFMMSIPIKIFEYMSFGVPILTSLEGEVKNLIESENLGFFFSENDPASFQKALIDLISNKDRLNSIHQNSTHLFEDRFSVDRTFKDRVSHIETIRLET